MPAKGQQLTLSRPVVRGSGPGCWSRSWESPASIHGCAPRRDMAFQAKELVHDINGRYGTEGRRHLLHL